MVTISAYHSEGPGSISAIALNFLNDCKKETKTTAIKKIKDKNVCNWNMEQ